MNVTDYAKALIQMDSVSSRTNEPISEYVEGVLSDLGFETERVAYQDRGVNKVNVIARRGTGPGGLAYFGHTDVVPADDWSISQHGPFEPTIRDGRLYGRGSTDMKGSIAAMLAAAASMTNQDPTHPLYICCTADEEIGHRGVMEVIARSELFRQLVDGAAQGIVGEPTGMQVVHGHKGGLQIAVTSTGVAAHSSTDEGVNANLAMIPFLQWAGAFHEETQCDGQWLDTRFDPPTLSLNIGINDENTALNITAPQSVCTLCMRPMPATDIDGLLDRVKAAADRFGLAVEIIGRNPSFWRDPNSEYVREVSKLIQNRTGSTPRTVAYGSEAANLTAVQDLIVLGPGDIAQAHRNDEWIEIDQLEAAQSSYQKLMAQYCE